MKKIKPGQFWSCNGCIVRARKRTSGCTGCLYEDSIILCPDVRTRNGDNSNKPNCLLNNIIFVKP
ncbi:MAG: hypothetical protein VZR53_00770 [Prevotella sp.]|nr:hypothetical protein [Prevotella sp.]